MDKLSIPREMNKTYVIEHIAKSLMLNLGMDANRGLCEDIIRHLGRSNDEALLAAQALAHNLSQVQDMVGGLARSLPKMIEGLENPSPKHTSMLFHP